MKNRPSGGASVVQKGKRKMQVFENQALAFCLVPGAGIEPARIAPLVFETSASTDSAIRAGVFREGGRVGRWSLGLLPVSPGTAAKTLRVAKIL